MPRQTEENIYMKPQDADKKKFEEAKQKPSAKLRMKSQVPLIHRAFDRGFVTPFGPLIGKTMMSHDLTVYPFKGDGRRRCFSMNLIMSVEST